MPDFTPIIERLEKATGGDRELDADIWLFFEPSRRPDVPAYTASLDAVVALVERLEPNACYRAEKLPPSGRHDPARPFWATCGLPGEQEAAYAATEPLARLLALFKALNDTNRPESGNG